MNLLATYKINITVVDYTRPLYLMHNVYALLIHAVARLAIIYSANSSRDDKLLRE